jgi:hypothetical protein
MTARKTASEGNMDLKRYRWTIGVVAVWLLVLGLTTVMAPAPAEANAVAGSGWRMYAPNHPNGCVSLAYDCYVYVVPPTLDR